VRDTATPTVLAESTYDEAANEWTHRCGTTVMAATVYHPVWLKGLTCAGTGEVRTETVPYCPTCQTKPNERGAPVYV
jgi:type IV secretory pathway TrbF-like protein